MPQYKPHRSKFVCLALGVAIASGVLFAEAQPAGGQRPRREVNVYFVSPTGDDANPGTEAKPFRTIQKGADACGPGDTVNIMGGVYRERVALNRSGSYFGRNITIQAAPGQKVVLDNKDLPPAAGQNGQAGSQAIFNTNGQDHLTIRGLTMQNGGFCGLSISGSWAVDVEDCRTSNTPGSGILVDKSHKVNISRFDIEKACVTGGEESLSVKRSADVTVRDGVVHDTFHEGIDIKEGSKHVRVLNNRVYNVERQGLYADAWDSDTYDIRFEGNVVYNCMVGLVACTESGGLLRDVWFVNNVIYDCKGPGMMVAKWGGQNFTHRMQNLYYLNNTVTNCGNGGKAGNWGGGMVLENDQAENVVVLNNVLSNNPQGQLKIALNLPPKRMTIGNNLLDGEAENLGGRNIIAPAKFVNPAAKDFRLQPSSRGVDAGRMVEWSAKTDVAGKPRVQGRTIDVGAYEAPATR